MPISRQIRNQSIPTNTIYIYHQDCAIPSGFAYDCCFASKYPTNIPNTCTCPGGCIGSHCHSEPAANCHSHCLTGSLSHSHTCPINNGSVITASTGATTAILPHKHNYTATNSATPCLGLQSSGTHTHDSQSNEPPYVETKFIKKTSGSFNLRNKHIPNCVVVMNAVALPPQSYTHVCAFNSKFPKGVPTCCTTVGTTGGGCCHTHGNQGHAHGITCGCHNHGLPGTLTGAAPTGGTIHCPGENRAYSPTANHTHTQNTLSVGNTDISTTTTDACHGHGSANHVPQNYEVVFGKKTSQSIRNEGLPPNSIVIWTCSLASVPSGYFVTDGTQGTVNMLSRLPLGVANSCTCPGTTGGNATHSHTTAAGTHSAHTIPCHNHTVTGVSSTFSCGTNSRSILQQSMPGASHYHAGITAGCTTMGCISGTNCNHTHGSSCNVPSSKRVAFLQKL